MDRIRPQQTPGMRWVGKSISLGHKPPVFCNRTRWGDGSRLDSRLGSAQLIPFEIGTYEFEVSSVSPVRILVNGTWAVDKFFSDPERITQSSKLVIAENGPKLVELEYYNQSIAIELSVNIRKSSE